MIDWTPIECDIPNRDPDAVVDGTDEEFYEQPWSEADEGEIFARCCSDSIWIGKKGDDCVSLWKTPNTADLEKALKESRCIFLREEIARYQAELDSLSG